MKDIELEDTDLENLYIARFDKLVEKHVAVRLLQDLKKEFPSVFFIAAYDDTKLKIAHVKNDKKIIISEV